MRLIKISFTKTWIDGDWFSLVKQCHVNNFGFVKCDPACNIMTASQEFFSFIRMHQHGTAVGQLGFKIIIVIFYSIIQVVLLFIKGKVGAGGEESRQQDQRKKTFTIGS